MKIIILKNNEMIIKKKEYYDLLIKISKLKQQTSIFYKYSINEIRTFFGLPKISGESNE